MGNPGKCVAALNDIYEGYFFTEELKLAIRKGYTVTAVHRLDKYNRGNVWGEFIRDLVVTKMSCERGPPSPEEREVILAGHEKFGMTDALLGKFDSFEKRPAMKMGAKITVNSVWGKNAQRPSMPRTTLYNDGEGFAEFMDNVASNRVKLHSFDVLGNQTYVKSSRIMEGGGGYDHHGAYLPMAVAVPAYGRMKLYEELDKLGERVLYHDTDSIFYVYKPEEYNIRESAVLGDWEVEAYDSGHGGMQAFVGTGPKSYALQSVLPCSDLCKCAFKQRDREFTIVKIKGISLRLSHASLMNFGVMEKLVLDYLAEDSEEIVQIPQFTFRYKIGRGMSTHYFIKNFKLQPSQRKGELRGKVLYPYGHE